MGNGATKDGSGQINGVANNIDEDLDDQELDKEFQAQLEAKRRQEKLKKGLNNKDLSNRNDLNNSQNNRIKAPKIVGLIESDDEVGNDNNDEERDDIKELDELNRTFGSLGISGNSRNSSVNKQIAPVNTNNDHMDEDDHGHNEENHYLMSSMSHTRFPPGTSMGRKGSILHFQQHSRPHQFQQGKNLKFSWDQRIASQEEKQNEDWTYKKVKKQNNSCEFICLFSVLTSKPFCNMQNI